MSLQSRTKRPFGLLIFLLFVSQCVLGGGGGGKKKNTLQEMEEELDRLGPQPERKIQANTRSQKNDSTKITAQDSSIVVRKGSKLLKPSPDDTKEIKITRKEPTLNTSDQIRSNFSHCLFTDYIDYRIQMIRKESKMPEMQCQLIKRAEKWQGVMTVKGNISQEIAEKWHGEMTVEGSRLSTDANREPKFARHDLKKLVDDYVEIIYKKEYVKKKNAELKEAQIDAKENKGQIYKQMAEDKKSLNASFKTFYDKKTYACEAKEINPKIKKWKKSTEKNLETMENNPTYRKLEEIMKNHVVCNNIKTAEKNEMGQLFKNDAQCKLYNMKLRNFWKKLDGLHKVVKQKLNNISRMSPHAADECEILFLDTQNTEDKYIDRVEKMIKEFYSKLNEAIKIKYSQLQDKYISQNNSSDYILNYQAFEKAKTKKWEKEFQTSHWENNGGEQYFLKLLPNEFLQESKRLSAAKYNNKFRDNETVPFTEKESRALEAVDEYDAWMTDNWTKTFRSNIEGVEEVEHVLGKPHYAWDVMSFVWEVGAEGAKGAVKWINGPDPIIIASVIALKVVLKVSGHFLKSVDKWRGDLRQKLMIEALKAYVPRRLIKAMKANFVREKQVDFNEALSKECEREKVRIKNDYVLSKSKPSFRKKSENSKIARTVSERKKSGNQ